jgi:hypothetical protein
MIEKEISSEITIKLLLVRINTPEYLFKMGRFSLKVILIPKIQKPKRGETSVD